MKLSFRKLKAPDHCRSGRIDRQRRNYTKYLIDRYNYFASRPNAIPTPIDNSATTQPDTIDLFIPNLSFAYQNVFSR